MHWILSQGRPVMLNRPRSGVLTGFALSQQIFFFFFTSQAVSLRSHIANTLRVRLFGACGVFCSPSQHSPRFTQRAVSSSSSSFPSSSSLFLFIGEDFLTHITDFAAAFLLLPSFRKINVAGGHTSRKLAPITRLNQHACTLSFQPRSFPIQVVVVVVVCHSGRSFPPCLCSLSFKFHVLRVRFFFVCFLLGLSAVIYVCEHLCICSSVT